MWSPLADSPPRSVAPAATSSGHQSARLGGTWMPTPGSSRCASAIRRFMSSSETGVAHVGRSRCGPVAEPGAPVLLRRRLGDLGRLLPVVALVRDEVLEDDLLQVAGRTRRAPRAPRSRSSSVSPMPTRIPLVNGIFSSPAARMRVEPRLGVLGRRALVGDEVGVDRLQHQPLRGGHLAQARQVLVGEDAEVGVRQQPALERALADPGDVGGEVGVPELGELLRRRPGGGPAPRRSGPAAP